MRNLDFPIRSEKNPTFSILGVSFRSFTLIELLVVVAIIAVLIAILLPALNQARELAKKVVCMSNLRQVSLAMNFYLDDYSNVYPPCYEVAHVPSDWQKVFWTQKLIPYIGNGWVMVCSLYDKRVLNPESDNYYGLFCNSGYAQYGYNHRALSCIAELSGWACNGPRWMRPTQVKQSEKLIMCLDYTHPLPFDRTYWPWATDEYFIYGWAWPKNHLDGENLLFVDGHIIWAPLEELYFHTDTGWKNRE